MRVLLKDAKNPNSNLVIPVTINVIQVDDTNTQDGEVIYVLEFKCSALDVDGNRIEDVIIDEVTADDVEQQIQEGLSIIGAQVDWPEQQDDTYAPRIIEIYPTSNQKDVPITSHVFGTIKDFFPLSGIDPSSIKLKVNGIDVSDELRLSGNEVEQKFRWIPPVLKK